MTKPRALHPIVVITAPSGAGKTTIARRIMQAVPEMQFSISITTRSPRPSEVDGRDYYFISEAEFRQHIEDDDLVEYEEVYPGQFYGTLLEEVERKANKGPILLDLDVKGALNVERMFGEWAFTLFVAPPSLDALAQRLRNRRTETEETLAVRLDRAQMEISMAHEFDLMVVNEDLEEASAFAIAAVKDFIATHRPL